MTGIYYHFSTTGEIIKKETNYRIPDDFLSKDLDLSYVENGCYMLSFSDENPVSLDQSTLSCINGAECYFFLMHQDNDFDDIREISKLPINKALTQFFPTSSFVGEIILVKTIEPFEENNYDYLLVNDEWSYNILDDYELYKQRYINKKYADI